MGTLITQNRQSARAEFKAAGEEAQRAVEAKPAALEQRIVQQITQCSERADALGDAIATERTDRQKEGKAALDEAQLTVETRPKAKLTTLEARFKALLPDKLPIAKPYRPDTVHYGR
jgi:flagellar motility protein MotE (MotC chaperone)